MLVFYDHGNLFPPFEVRPQPQRCVSRPRQNVIRRQVPRYNSYFDAREMNGPEFQEPEVYVRRMRKGLNLLVDLDGNFEKSSVRVRVHGRKLQITAVQKPEPRFWFSPDIIFNIPKDGSRVWKRVFELPDHVNTEAISATFSKGGSVLSVSCPFFTEEPRKRGPRRIEIHEGESKKCCKDSSENKRSKKVSETGPQVPILKGLPHTNKDPVTCDIIDIRSSYVKNPQENTTDKEWLPYSSNREQKSNKKDPNMSAQMPQTTEIDMNELEDGKIEDCDY